MTLQLTVVTRSREAGGWMLNCVESRVHLNRIVSMIFFFSQRGKSLIRVCRTTNGKAEIQSKWGQLGLHHSMLLCFPLQRWKGAFREFVLPCLDVAVSKAKRRHGDRAGPTFFFPGHMQGNGSEPGTIQGEATVPRQ